MRKFGLIGYPLTHSFSKKYFTRIFEEEGIDAVYENFPISDITLFPRLMQDERPEGINVTIPYKEAVLQYLDEVSDAVAEIGACNCIRVEDGKRKGFNTDVVGFEQSLLKLLQPTHNRALVLGTGGASKAVCYVLRKLGIPYQVVSRTKADGITSYGELDAGMVSGHRLIINTTPLGMYPVIGEAPPIPYEGIGASHYLYDLVYNPERTLFLQEGERRGALVANGYDMLIIQANESRKIWGV